MTLKEQLDAANANLAAAETARDGFKTQLDSEVAAHAVTKSALTAAETARDGFEAKLDLEIAEHATTKTALATEQAKDKTAGNKAAEQLAAAGIVPPAKDSPKALDANNADPAATWEKYAAADAVTQSQMRKELGTKLDAAAKAFERHTPPR